jgi:cell division protein FtsB
MQRIEATQSRHRKTAHADLRFEREEMLLKRDPEFISVIARDKLELMKDGETIYQARRSEVRSGEVSQETLTSVRSLHAVSAAA